MTDLLLFTGAVYGLSWAVTRARVGAPIRKLADGWKLIETLSVCIVCLSAWVGLGLGLLARHSTLLELRVETVVDGVLVVGWSMSTTWLIGRATGDAE